MISLHLVSHRHAVLAPPELVVQLGVMQGQADEGGKLCDQLLVLLIIIIIIITIIIMTILLTLVKVLVALFLLMSCRTPIIVPLIMSGRQKMEWVV